MKNPTCPCCGKRHQYRSHYAGALVSLERRDDFWHCVALAKCDRCQKKEIGVWTDSEVFDSAPTDHFLFKGAISKYPPGWQYLPPSNELLCQGCAGLPSDRHPASAVSRPPLPRHRSRLLLGRG